MPAPPTLAPIIPRAAKKSREPANTNGTSQSDGEKRNQSERCRRACRKILPLKPLRPAPGGPCLCHITQACLGHEPLAQALVVCEGQAPVPVVGRQGAHRGP